MEAQTELALWGLGVAPGSLGAGRAPGQGASQSWGCRGTAAVCPPGPVQGPRTALGCWSVPPEDVAHPPRPEPFPRAGRMSWPWEKRPPQSGLCSPPCQRGPAPKDRRGPLYPHCRQHNLTGRLLLHQLSLPPVAAGDGIPGLVRR